MDLAGDLSLVHDEIRHTASQLSGTRQYERVSRLSFFEEFEESEADVEVDVLRPGATFGELGFIVNQARTATIVAQDKVTVLKVRSSLIERTSVNCQLRYQKAFLKNLAERFCSTMNFIARLSR
jgi:CRP-like cAMP-binding protein